MSGTLHRKTIVITGASSGIGLACAEAFARHGSNLVLGARRFVDLCAIAQSLEKEYGIRAVAVQCDVAMESDCKALVQQAINTFGGVDALINNAGISMRALFADLDLAVLHRLMDVNFWGTVYCTKYAMAELLQSQGSVVAVSSIAGYRGLPGRTGYSASKFAIQGFMESLRVENLKTGLHVMVACPGFTASNIRQTALNAVGSEHGETSMNEDKMMTAEEVAARIVQGIIRRKRTLIMTRQGKLAVLMNKLLPDWVDRQVYKLFAKERNPLVS
ncbi:short chain dehydrogenase [Parapedobacter pyrenivorans]|uniref:Short chain dehydrogenase n=1 Tax=Parapedobacter pyrenivorans TaxID=1305674 RepID=A0A917HRW4_9SPHI|nr:SDR family oxidoreductase [Parapedobacter pyrenivorans]GGG87471.1 short chain dehydrogenase [Parapedobacter pyrenivorans]